MLIRTMNRSKRATMWKSNPHLFKRNFSTKFGPAQWILNYEARMKECYGGDSLEFAGRQFMSGCAFAFISVSFLIGAVVHDFYQYFRFNKIRKQYFFKTGVIDVSNEKARPSPEDFPIHKIYPQRVLIQLLVHEYKHNSKGSSNEKWKKSDKLTQIYSPKIDIEKEPDVSSEDEKIKFDFTYTINVDTFLNNTTPPIVVGKTSEPTENEIKIIQDKFKEWKLFYIDQENGFFYFIKNPSNEEKASTNIRNEESYKKHIFKEDDIRVKVKIWDSDDYTLFCKTENFTIEPFKFMNSNPLLYLTKNRNIYFEDIKLKYDTNWVLYRMILINLGLICYAANQLMMWGIYFSNYGIYRITKRFGPVPVLFVLGVFGYWCNLQSSYYARSYKRLEAIELNDPKMKPTLMESFFS